MTKNLKSILLIGPAYPLRGGIADFNQALCKTLKTKGLDCKIVSYSLQYPEILFPGKTQYVDSSTQPPEIDIFSSINSINPLSWIKTIKLIKKLNPQLIITAFWIPFTAISTGFILSRLKKEFTTIALAHNIIPHDRKPGDRAITKFFIKQNQGFILLSEAVSKELDQFDKNKKRIVLYHPIYDIFGEPVPKAQALRYLELPGGRYVLFFGLIKKYKGLETLLKAFATEELKNSDIQLIIAGEFYENKEKYLKIIKDSGIENKVILKDFFIPADEVKYYFSAADIVVQPYLSATQSGISQIAYNFEKPMIVTDVGGLREIVKDGKGGYVVPKENPQALAKAIKKFFDENKKEEFTSFVKKEKQKFSWDYFADKVLEFYKSLDNV